MPTDIHGHKFFGIQNDTEVIDFGCGNGRHVLELAKYATYVVGIDSSKNAINAANSTLATLDLTGKQHITFLLGDCRQIHLDQQFDIGVCLYDVIGSYASMDDNIAILRNLATHIKAGGKVAISVMSFEYTEPLIPQAYKCTEEQIFNHLPSLPATSIMQTTGDIFTGQSMLLDVTNEELIRLCADVGFDRLACGFVSAGKFEYIRNGDRVPNKEILFLGVKQHHRTTSWQD